VKLEERVMKLDILKGLTFAVTGTLKNFTREEIVEFFEKLGAKVVNSVSRNTDYLIVGENPGSKYEKAKMLKVKTMSEEEFLEFVRKRAELKGYNFDEIMRSWKEWS